MNSSDFSKGSVLHHIYRLAIPLMLAQFVQVAYNIVDRIYIGHLDTASSLALTGLGLCFPLITLITAFTNLFGLGGAPLCSIARGKKEDELASKILGNTIFGLVLTSLVLVLVLEIFQAPILNTLGASQETLPYASSYLSIYLLGTPFLMFSSGLNGFINLQGYPKLGMMTVCLGAITNILLDPILIFGFHLGIQGAAIATVISQFFSFLWVLLFFKGKKNQLGFSLKQCLPHKTIQKKILSLGTAGFIATGSNAFVSMVINASLSWYGNGLYIAIMAILNSVRDVLFLPLEAMNGAIEPVIGYNLGAGCIPRIKEVIKYTTLLVFGYLLIAWILLFLFPGQILSIFNNDPHLIQTGIPLFHLYYFGIFLMAGQYVGQGTFVGLNKPKHAIFFSTFRKILVILPLTLLLPRIPSLGIQGIFIAEPISNLLGGCACYFTMLHTVKKL
ncbi:MATE family efflux transporter [uncultured Faecalicoccus sp.]|uniref:MATE family efflux transporter n=1 Tax=uncultured Faecalicoccus sp. TaxID=1971760 RepID=UPI002637E3D3|nr:MATE family efflux transporter [uncultured Faecalicoccus sp.]